MVSLSWRGHTNWSWCVTINLSEAFFWRLECAFRCGVLSGRGAGPDRDRPRLLAPRCSCSASRSPGRPGAFGSVITAVAPHPATQDSVCCAVIWFAVSLDLFIARDETQATSYWLIRNTWYAESFRSALTEQTPLLCRCDLPALLQLGTRRCSKVRVHVPPVSVHSLRSCCSFPCEQKQLLWELVLSAAVLAWHGDPAIVDNATRVQWSSCPFASSRGINVFAFGFSRNEMRLPRLTERAEWKHLLDGSLPDLLLKKANPGNLPLQLILEEKKPVKHQF